MTNGNLKISFKKYFTFIPFIFSISNIMAQKQIKTEITIKSTPEKVWQILTDLENYPNWNPFILSASGELKVDEQIKIELADMKFKPKVLVYEENKELRWIGKFLFKGVFDGEHSFQIVDNNDGTVTFKHEEIFNGILVGLFSKKLDTETKNGFIQMNEKLKELAEASF